MEARAVTLPSAAPRSEAPRTRGLRRAILIGTGCTCVALGFAGIFVPGLPTTVFLLAAAWLFARSSPRLHRALLAHPRLSLYLRAAEERAMPRRAKALTLVAIWVGTALGALALAPRSLAAVATVALAALVGTAVIVLWIRTDDARAARGARALPATPSTLRSGRAA